jgi:para-nitrobenzyl esterase
MTDVLEPPASLLHSEAVATRNGPVRGYRDGGLHIFKGLRYGAPPIGPLRFRPPVRPKAWTEPADAVSLGTPALQAGLKPGEKTGGRSAGDPPAPGEPGTGEDCLFLNVWTPGLDAGARPVMVWLHGGGFANGSGGAAMYDGAALTRRGDVVTVTVNHRLNLFGYLHLGELGGDPQSGVAGMLDIVLALEWVRDNIAAFGGDASNVTIFGESGGGWKVCLLQAMPSAAGLFHKAIVQSGPGLRAIPREVATKSAAQLLQALGIAAGDLSRLETLPAEAIQEAAASVTSDRLMGAFVPCLDGVALPRDPFHPDAAPLSAAIPLMVGTNKDEATLFNLGAPGFGKWTEEDLAKRARAAVGDKADALVAALRVAYPDYSPTHLICAVQTATNMWANSITLAERKSAQGGAPVFMYQMTWETPVARGGLRCPHALEIPLVFDNVEAARSFVGRGEAPQQMAEQMAPAWLAFARTGDPNSAALPPWPPYDAATRGTMIFDLESRVENDPLPEVRRILQG